MARTLKWHPERVNCQQPHAGPSWFAPSTLGSGNPETLAESLDKPLEWAVGFFFGNLELSMDLWTVIAEISGFDD